MTPIRMIHRLHPTVKGGHLEQLGTFWAGEVVGQHFKVVLIYTMNYNARILTITGTIEIHPPLHSFTKQTAS